MKDWIGLWFKIQAERGHSDEVPLVLTRFPQKNFENHSFLHRYKDGVAALSEALTEKGMVPTREGKRSMARPNALAISRLLLRGLAGNSQGGRPGWKVFHPDRREKPRHFSFLYLNEFTNSALDQFLKKNQISLSAYLLSRLAPAMEGELFQDEVLGDWLLPVDMRPAYPNRPLSGNCVSYIKIPAQKDAHAIHRRIKGALRAFEHWSNWWVYHIGKVVGYRGMQRLSHRSSLRTFWLGSFTDLGDWTPAQPASLDEYRESVWAIAAPGTPNNPVGCATIAWFGKRSISLRIHPAISENCRESTRMILDRLAELIFQDSGEKPELIEIDKLGG